MKLERVLLDTNIKPPIGAEGEMRRDFVTAGLLLVERDDDGTIVLSSPQQTKKVSAHRVIEWIERERFDGPVETTVPYLGMITQTEPTIDAAAIARSEKARKAANARHAKGKSDGQ